MLIIWSKVALHMCIVVDLLKEYTCEWCLWDLLHMYVGPEVNSPIKGSYNIQIRWPALL